jgi:TolB-like protein
MKLDILGVNNTLQDYSCQRSKLEKKLVIILIALLMVTLSIPIYKSIKEITVRQQPDTGTVQSVNGPEEATRDDGAGDIKQTTAGEEVITEKAQPVDKRIPELKKQPASGDEAKQIARLPIMRGEKRVETILKESLQKFSGETGKMTDPDHAEEAPDAPMAKEPVILQGKVPLEDIPAGEEKANIVFREALFESEGDTGEPEVPSATLFVPVVKPPVIVPVPAEQELNKDDEQTKTDLIIEDPGEFEEKITPGQAEIIVKQPALTETVIPDKNAVASVEHTLQDYEKGNSPKEIENIISEVTAGIVENRVALLPFDNLSDNKNALRQVMPALVRHLEKRGIEVVDEDKLNEYLCEERVRATGYVSKELAQKIRTKFKVKAILAGSIISYYTEEYPRFGILARLIDSSDASILWADYASATGEDYTTVLGLGKLRTIFSLIPRVMDELFVSFNYNVLERPVDIGTARRIAVMPFQNNSNFRNAGVIAMYMFIIELLKNDNFEPIEYGNIRNTIISLKIRNRGDLDHSKISALSERLGARGIVVGVVDSFSNGETDSSHPKVAITARLLDGRNNKIIWYNSHELSGEENIIALDWGRIRSVHGVAKQVVSGLVTKMGVSKWD